MRSQEEARKEGWEGATGDDTQIWEATFLGRERKRKAEQGTSRGRDR